MNRRATFARAHRSAAQAVRRSACSATGINLIDLLEKRVFLAAHPSLPLLSSLPSAPANLFLDFDGDTSPTGRTQAAMNFGSDPAVFDTFEQVSIRNIWARVAEWFSPFNLNVTTEDPG